MKSLQRFLCQIFTGAVLLFCLPVMTLAQTIVPTQTDEIIIDNNSSGKADPGDRIRYKVTIQNTGGTGATGTQLNVVPDPRTTFVAGTFLSSPLALPDAYTCTGNVPIFVAAPGVKGNDFDEGAPGSLSISTATDQATLRGGSVDIFADGSFEYTPPAGYEGDDSFTYTLNDATQAGPGAPVTDVGTVTITISGMIWFINNAVAAGDGRLSSPFNSLGAFNTANGGMTMNNGDVVNPEVNETIFLYTGSGNYISGIGLLNGQKLFGQGASTANLGTLTGITFAPNSIALPMAGGTPPVITNAAGDGIQLGQNNTLRGFDVGACSDFGIDNNGVISVGNLVVSEVTINNTTGGGFDAGNGSGAGMNAVFNSISSTGGINGINLTNCAGTFTVNGGTITNPGGPGVLIVGGTVVFACSAVVSDNSGFAVDVSDHDSGNVTLSGNITSTDSGIRVQNCNGGTKTFSGSSKNLNTGAITAVRLINNTGALIDFSGGGLVINTTTGTGFSATGGGTVSVTGAGNTISSTSGTAFNMASTTIGGSGITFQSISKNGGTNNAIALSSTGAGAFSVTGTGSAGSGGTLQNISGADAVSLNTTGGLVSLQYLVIQDITDPNDASAALQTHSGVDGIHGIAVNGGLTLSNSTIQRISDNAINGSVDASPVTGNPTSTTWTNLTLTNCTFQNTNRFHVPSLGDATNESAVHIRDIDGTISVTGCTFQNVSSGLEFYTKTSGTLDMTVRSNTFHTLYKEIGTNSVGRYGISVIQQGSLTSVIRIGDTAGESNAALGNTFTNGGNVTGIRIVSETTSTGNLKTSIAKNTFTVTDHSSPGQAPLNIFYNFPQSGVLMAARGTGNYEGIFAANVFDQAMHADGGLGQFTMIAEKGASEFIVRNNTFGLPWDLPMELRADGQSGVQTSCQVLVTGNTHIDGTVGDGTTDLGGLSPYGSTYVQVRNGGKMDLTMQNEATPLGLTDPSSSTGTVSLFTQTTSSGDVFNLFLQNLQGPRGYRLSHAAGSTFNLFRNGSAAGTAQGVLQDNGNRGGAGVDTTNPPSVNATGTITLSNTIPMLPSIIIP